MRSYGECDVHTAPGSFIHLFNEYLSNTYYVPGTVVTGVGEIVVNKIGKNVCPHGADVLLSTKLALPSAIFCLIRGIDICWHLRGTSGL